MKRAYAGHDVVPHSMNGHGFLHGHTIDLTKLDRYPGRKPVFDVDAHNVRAAQGRCTSPGKTIRIQVIGGPSTEQAVDLMSPKTSHHTPTTSHQAPHTSRVAGQTAPQATHRATSHNPVAPVPAHHVVKKVKPTPQAQAHQAVHQPANVAAHHIARHTSQHSLHHAVPSPEVYRAAPAKHESKHRAAPEIQPIVKHPAKAAKVAAAKIAPPVVSTSAKIAAKPIPQTPQETERAIMKVLLPALEPIPTDTAPQPRYDAPQSESPRSFDEFNDEELPQDEAKAMELNMDLPDESTSRRGRKFLTFGLATALFILLAGGGITVLMGLMQ